MKYPSTRLPIHEDRTPERPGHGRRRLRASTALILNGQSELRRDMWAGQTDIRKDMRAGPAELRKDLRPVTAPFGATAAMAAGGPVH